MYSASQSHNVTAATLGGKQLWFHSHIMWKDLEWAKSSHFMANKFETSKIKARRTGTSEIEREMGDLYSASVAMVLCNLGAGFTSSPHSLFPFSAGRIGLFISQTVYTGRVKGERVQNEEADASEKMRARESV